MLTAPKPFELLVGHDGFRGLLQSLSVAVQAISVSTCSPDVPTFLLPHPFRDCQAVPWPWLWPLRLPAGSARQRGKLASKHEHHMEEENFLTLRDVALARSWPPAIVIFPLRETTPLAAFASKRLAHPFSFSPTTQTSTTNPSNFFPPLPPSSSLIQKHFRAGRLFLFIP